MIRSLSTLAVLALALPLQAQEPVRGERPEMGPDRVMQFVMNRRARLGLKVNLRARETDSIGAFVDAVTPNGPAAKAGVRSGDIITKVDQKSVLTGGETVPHDARQSSPGLRLIELAAALEPNDTISLEYRRGKERKTVTLVTTDEPNILIRGRSGRQIVGVSLRAGQSRGGRGTR